MSLQGDKLRGRRALNGERVFSEKFPPACPQTVTVGRDRDHLCSHHCGCLCLGVAQGSWPFGGGCLAPGCICCLGAESAPGSTD